jgi:hypothetical protein
VRSGQAAKQTKTSSGRARVDMGWDGMGWPDGGRAKPLERAVAASQQAWLAAGVHARSSRVALVAARSLLVLATPGRRRHPRVRKPILWTHRIAWRHRHGATS